MRKVSDVKSRFDLKFIDLKSRVDPRNTSRVSSQRIDWRRRRRRKRCWREKTVWT